MRVLLAPGRGPQPVSTIMNAQEHSGKSQPPTGGLKDTVFKSQPARVCQLGPSNPETSAHTISNIKRVRSCCEHCSKAVAGDSRYY